MAAKIDRLLCAAGAAILGGASAVMVWRVVGYEAAYLRLPAAAAALAALGFLLGAVVSGGWYQRLVRACSILMINTGIVFGMAEGVCRVAQFDFNDLLGVRKKNEAFPIYFRLPTRPVGDVFFARHGPDQWTGKPLTTLLKNHRSTDADYADEAVVTIRYDKDGFRNPDDLKDWDIVIVGDSFTESGYLPPDQIFTGHFARLVGKRVKNLGVTDTGNFTHAHYLRTYGTAASCRAAVLAFFEGNDLTDNARERKDLQHFRATGERPSHDIPREPSLLRTVYHFARDFRQLNLRPRSYANAFFKAAGGGEVPVTIADAPPSSASMSEDEKTALQEALDQWAAACRDLGVEPALLYLPCKRRVLHGHMRQGVDYPEPQWQPGDLLAHVESECRTRGIRFIDPTSALMKKSEAGVITFNAIYDTHLNREGHRVVAEVLAREFSPTTP